MNAAAHRFIGTLRRLDGMGSTLVLTRKRYRLRLPSRTLALGERTLIMGVLNVTPDSFFDGGKYLDTPAAIARALSWSARAPT